MTSNYDQNSVASTYRLGSGARYMKNVPHLSLKMNSNTILNVNTNIQLYGITNIHTSVCVSQVHAFIHTHMHAQIALTYYYYYYSPKSILLYPHQPDSPEKIILYQNIYLKIYCIVLMKLMDK